jgi:hypothetical protein
VDVAQSPVECFVRSGLAGNLRDDQRVEVRALLGQQPDDAGVGFDRLPARKAGEPNGIEGFRRDLDGAEMCWRRNSSVSSSRTRSAFTRVCRVVGIIDSKTGLISDPPREQTSPGECPWDGGI